MGCQISSRAHCVTKDQHLEGCGPTTKRSPPVGYMVTAILKLIQRRRKHCIPVSMALPIPPILITADDGQLMPSRVKKNSVSHLVDGNAILKRHKRIIYI